MYKVIVYTCVFEGAPYFNDFESMCAPHFRLGKRQISTQCQEIRQFLSRYWGPITPHSSHRLMFSQKIEWRAAANAPDRRCSISLAPSLPLCLSLSGVRRRWGRSSVHNSVHARARTHVCVYKMTVARINTDNFTRVFFY